MPRRLARTARHEATSQPLPATAYVVSVDGSAYLAWQRRLLELSCAAVGVASDLHVRADLAPVRETVYRAANRPFALRRWLAERDACDCQVCVLDPDMLLLHRVDVACRPGELIADDGHYPFSERTLRTLRRHVRRPERLPLAIPPVIMRQDDLATLAGLWFETTLALWEDRETRNALGWLCEMWALPLAAQAAGLRIVLRRLAHVPPAPSPPDPLVLHYAWRTAYFDKREYVPWVGLSRRASPAYDQFRAVVRLARQEDGDGTVEARRETTT